jgi:hypothetical protein
LTGINAEDLPMWYIQPVNKLLLPGWQSLSHLHSAERLPPVAEFYAHRFWRRFGLNF